LLTKSLLDRLANFLPLIAFALFTFTHNFTRAATVGDCSYTDSKGLVVSACYFTPDFSAKAVNLIGLNGEPITRIIPRSKTTVAWASDNITKTTRYEYADKSIHSVSERVDAAVTKTVAGMIQTTTTSYGNPKAKPVVTKETGALVADSVGLTPDFASKRATYRFSDGTESIVTTNRTKTTVAWASDNITKTTRYEYADKSIHSVSERFEPTETVTWSNNITKITVTVFGNGIQTRSQVTVQPHEPPVQYSEAVYPNTWASGGGGAVAAPSISARQKVYGNGYIEVFETGTAWQPFP
jgi:hypothetical protein